MYLIQFEQFGSPLKVLKLVEKPDPKPGPNEIRIKMTYRTINPSDLYYISGEYGIKPKLPATPGFEGTGIIDYMGSNVKNFKFGQRVIPLGELGTWSEYLIVKPGMLLLVPEKIKDQTAAQLIINCTTAWILTTQELRLKKDQWLLQTAAGSTLGRLVLQIAKIVGFKTVNFVRRRDQVAELLDLGADHVICTEDTDIVKQVMQITNGVHAAIDAVGGKTGSLAMNCLRVGGTLIVYGLLSGERISFNTSDIIFKESIIRGFWLNRWFKRTPSDQILSILNELMQLMVDGKIDPPVEAEYDFKDFKAAIEHALLKGRHGKVILKST